MSTSRATPASKQRSATARRMAEYRKRMRAAGYRQVQMWVLDTRRPEVAAQIERQCRAIAESDPAGDEIMEWLDQVRDWSDL